MQRASLKAAMATGGKRALDWRPKRLDLYFSVLIALGLPPVAGSLYAKTGAFLPMLLYYGLAWVFVKWRRGSIGYGNPMPARPPLAFYLNLALIAACLVFARLSPVVNPAINPAGILLTALVWAPLNAASEQILWIYLYEAWDLYPKPAGAAPRIAYRALGLALFTAFVGLIHTVFWVKFLHTVDAGTAFGILFVSLTSLSGFLHIIVWRKSRQMIFTFIPHLLLNLVPIAWTHYSISPYLFR